MFHYFSFLKSAPSPNLDKLRNWGWAGINFTNCDRKKGLKSKAAQSGTSPPITMPWKATDKWWSFLVHWSSAAAFILSFFDRDEDDGDGKDNDWFDHDSCKGRPKNPIGKISCVPPNSAVAPQKSASFTRISLQIYKFFLRMKMLTDWGVCTPIQINFDSCWGFARLPTATARWQPAQYSWSQVWTRNRFMDLEGTKYMCVSDCWINIANLTISDQMTRCLKWA